MVRFSVSRQFGKKLIRKQAGSMFSIQDMAGNKKTCRVSKNDNPLSNGIVVNIMNGKKGQVETIHMTMIKSVKIKGIDYQVIH